tara:strand:+ start:167 stop:451 length:285 start_codon:yes stop_codon:yes gene_type:complete
VAAEAEHILTLVTNQEHLEAQVEVVEEMVDLEVLEHNLKHLEILDLMVLVMVVQLELVPIHRDMLEELEELEDQVLLKTEDHLNLSQHFQVIMD